MSFFPPPPVVCGRRRRKIIPRRRAERVSVFRRQYLAYGVLFGRYLSRWALPSPGRMLERVRNRRRRIFSVRFSFSFMVSLITSEKVPFFRSVGRFSLHAKRFSSHKKKGENSRCIFHAPYVSQDRRCVRSGNHGNYQERSNIQTKKESKMKFLRPTEYWIVGHHNQGLLMRRVHQVNSL